MKKRLPKKNQAKTRTLEKINLAGVSGGGRTCGVRVPGRIPGKRIG